MAVATLSGIVCVYNVMQGNQLAAYFAAFLPLFLCFIAFLERKRCEKGDVFALIVLSVLFFMVSGTITALKISSFTTADVPNGNYIIIGTVADVSQGETVTTLSLTDVSLGNFEETEKISANFQLYVNDLDVNISVGERISCYCYVNLQDAEGDFFTYYILNNYKFEIFIYKTGLESSNLTYNTR